MLPLLQFSSSELSPQLLVPSHCKVMGISPHEHGKTSTFFSVIKKMNRFVLDLVKGQLISKCPNKKSVSSKIPTKLFLDFCPEIF